MTRISENDRAFRLVATARAVLASPENVACLPLVQIALNEVTIAEFFKREKEAKNVASNHQG
jgi:hypothetical protein